MSLKFPGLIPRVKSLADLEYWTSEVRDMFTRLNAIDWSLIDDTSFDVAHTTSSTFTMDSDDTGGNVDLVFGTTVNKYLRHTGTQFQLNDDLLIDSDLTLSSGSILSASGTISFGNENLETLGVITASNFISACLAGTAPYACTSTDLNTNLNADLLDSQHGSYFLDSNNFTGTEWADLTDAGDSLLHYHASDRDSANFTGTNWGDLTDGTDTILHSHAGASLTYGIGDTVNNGTNSSVLFVDGGLLAQDNSNFTFDNATNTLFANIVSTTALGLTGFTEGSMLFRGATYITEDNANFFWNNTYKQLGIGTAAFVASSVGLQIGSHTGASNSVTYFNKLGGFGGYSAANAITGYQIEINRSRGTMGTPLIVGINDRIFEFAPYFYDGAVYSTSGNFGVKMAGSTSEAEFFSDLHFHLNDNKRMVFGTGRDAYIYYDGTNLILDPNIVGTGGVLIPSTDKLLFRDSAISINSANDTFLDLVADGGIRLTAPRTNISGDLYVGSDVADSAIVFDGSIDGQITWMEDEGYFIFSHDVKLTDAKNLVIDTTTGSKLGASDTAKVSVYNADPIVRQNHIADATDAASAITQLNLLIAAIENFGILKTA